MKGKVFFTLRKVNGRGFSATGLGGLQNPSG